MSDSCLLNQSKSFNDFISGVEYKKLYDSSDTLDCSGSDLGKSMSIYNDVLSITDELFPKLDPSNCSSSQDINLTLDKLNFISRWDEESTYVVNKVIRTKDIMLRQAPYTSLRNELYRTNDVNVGKNILSIFNSLLSSPSIKVSMKEEIWTSLNHIPDVNIFNEFKNPQCISILLDYMNLYLEQLRQESLMLPQQVNPFHSILLDNLYQSISKDEESIQKDYWKNLSVLGIRFIIYFSHFYNEAFKNLFDKYSIKSSSKDETLISIINQTIKITINSIEFCLDYLSSPNENEESPTLKMYKTLTSTPYAFYELCSISLITFDKLSLTNQSESFKSLRHTISLSIQEFYNIPMIKTSLLISKYHNRTENIDETLLNNCLNRYNIRKEDTTLFFQELSNEITLEENKDELDYLSYVIKALTETISSPSFSFSYLTSKTIAFILSNLTRPNSIWMKHMKLSTAITQFIEVILTVDVKGIKKFREALRSNAKSSNTPNEIYKPIIKLIRNNWTFNSSIRIINILFEKKHSISEKKQFIQELLASEALTLIKSKSWSTVSRSEELYIFQSNILTYDKMPFEHINEDHINLLISCWNIAFENMKITNGQIRKEQWQILGFNQFESLKYFSSITVKSLENLLHFAKKFTNIYRTLVLYDGEIPIHVGDCGILIFESIMKCANSGVIIPLLFDGSEETIGDMYVFMWLWVIQKWFSTDMSLDLKKVISQLDKFILDSLSKSKPSSLQEFYRILNIKKEYFEGGIKIDNEFQPREILLGTSSSRKLRAFPDVASYKSIPQNKKVEELNIVDQYMEENKELFTWNDNENLNEQSASVKKKKEIKKPYLKSNYYQGTLSMIYEELKLHNSFNAKKIASITGSSIGYMLDYIRIGDNEKEKDILKRRKAELKEQKQMKNMISRHKSLHKKIVE